MHRDFGSFRRRRGKVFRLMRFATVQGVLVSLSLVALSVVGLIASAYTGSASWYDLSGNTTACGEVMDGSDYTAASRVYPCGTLLEVSSGGASVTVRVNDYGPAAWTGHEIDLSRAAADALGITYAGEATVAIQELGSASATASASASASAASSASADASSSASASPNTSSYGHRQAILAEARALLGTPYWSMNCSRFTRLVYGNATGTWMEADYVAQRSYGSPAWTLKRGDLVLYADGNAVYAGGGKVIMASHYYGEVHKIDMDYLYGYLGARRLS